jgi:hypothetical protein
MYITFLVFEIDWSNLLDTDLLSLTNIQAPNGWKLSNICITAEMFNLHVATESIVTHAKYTMLTDKLVWNIVCAA